jgi:uncharacterized CHY-type Zn-finger protein
VNAAAPGARVFGAPAEDQAGCVHSPTQVDVAAMKFACGRRYYLCHLCHLCHAEDAHHEAQTWPPEQRAEPAVLCGVREGEMSIDDCLATTSCPSCGACRMSGAWRTGMSISGDAANLCQKVLQHGGALNLNVKRRRCGLLSFW